MNFTQLNYLISVAKHRNFTAAAKEMYVTQPAITHQIQELEKELNVKLFIRNPKKVELTSAGEIFLEDAKRLVSIMEESKQKLLQNEHQSDLKLKIAYLASSSRSFLPHAIDKFHQKYPSVSVEMLRCNATDVINYASQNKYDIYCSMTEDLSMLSNLSLKTIFTDYFCLVTKPDHPALSNLSIDYQKLSSEPFVFFSPEEGALIYKQSLRICESLGFTPRITATYHLMEEVLYAVASGIGITILPYRTKGYINDNLSYTLLDAPNISVSSCIAWHKDSQNPALRMFLEVFQEVFQNHPEFF